MSYNFREFSCNRAVNEQKKRIYHLVHKYINEKNLSGEFDKFEDLVLDYYDIERRKDYSAKEAKDRAYEICSEFYQNLIYYVIHNIKDEHQDEVLKIIIERKLFFYTTMEGKIALWVDSKEKDNVITSSCRHKNKICLESVVDKYSLAYEKNKSGNPSVGELLFSKNKNDFTTLVSAAYDGFFEVLDYLLNTAEVAFGGKNNHKYRDYLSELNKDGFSALSSACLRRHPDIVDRLVIEAEIAFGGMNTEDFKRFISQTNDQGFSPFMNACMSGDTAIVKRMLIAARGAFANDVKGFFEFINYKDKAGYTPLISACREGHLEIVDLLLEAAEVACQGKNTDAFRNYLITVNEDGFSALNTVCKSNSLPIMNRLLNVAEDACEGKSTAFYKNLIKLQNKHLYSPLSSLCANGHIEMTKQLLSVALESFKADAEGFFEFLTTRDMYGYSPLIQAIKTKAEIVDLLIDAAKQAFIGKHQYFKNFLKHTNRSGFTPLHWAIKLNNPEMISKFISLMEEACGGTDNKEFRDYLSQTNGNGFPPLNTACRTGNVETVSRLLTAAVSSCVNDPQAFFEFIHQQDSIGYTPLHAAAKEGHLSIVVLLVETVEKVYGKDHPLYKQFLESTINDFHCTPLNVATLSKKKDVAEFLVSKGANPLLRNNSNFSALDNAKKIPGWDFMDKAVKNMRTNNESAPGAKHNRYQPINDDIYTRNKFFSKAEATALVKKEGKAEVETETKTEVRGNLKRRERTNDDYRFLDDDHYGRKNLFSDSKRPKWQDKEPESTSRATNQQRDSKR